MVQNLNNNLITAPELADLRKRLRNLETKVRYRACVSKEPTAFNKLDRMDKRSSWLYFDHGVIMLLQHSLFVSWHKRTNRLTICFRFCRYCIESREGPILIRIVLNLR